MNQKDLDLINKKKLIQSQLEKEYLIYKNDGLNKKECINKLNSSIEKWSINLYNKYTNKEATSYIDYAYSVIEILK